MKHIYHIILASLLTLMSSSCVRPSSTDIIIDPDETGTIEMHVLMLSPTTSDMKTRAVASPTEAVRRIDVYSFDASGTFMRHTPFPSPNNPLKDVTTDDQKAQGIAEYKMVTQVIMPSDPNNTERNNFLFTNLTEAQVATLRDKVNDKSLTIDDVKLLIQEIENSDVIPTDPDFNFQMWGKVHYFDFFNNPKKIYMYRNVAKLSLSLSDALSTDYEINTVKIAGKRNLKSYLMPAEHESITNLGETLVDKHLNIPSQTPVEANISMSLIDGRYVGYTFEYNNKEAGTDDKQYLLLSVRRTSDNKILWYRVDIYNNTKKEYYNIIRNHHYKITITDIQPGSGYETEQDAITNALIGNNILNADILDIDELMTNIISNGQLFLAVSKDIETYGGQNEEVSLGFVETSAGEIPSIQVNNTWITGTRLVDLGDGKKFEIKATIDHQGMTADREGSITFKVKGLERTLKVFDKLNSFEFEYDTNFLSYRKDFPTYLRAKLKYPVSPVITPGSLSITPGASFTMAMESQDGDEHNQWVVFKASPKNDRYDPVSNHDLGQAFIKYPGFADGTPQFRQAHFIDGIGETAKDQYKHGIMAIYRDDTDDFIYTVTIEGIYGDWSMESNKDWIEIANEGETPRGKAFIAGQSNAQYQTSQGAALSSNGTMRFSYRLKPNDIDDDRFGRILFHYNNNQATHVIYVHQGLRDVVMPNMNGGADLSSSVTWAATNSTGGVDGKEGTVFLAPNPSHVGDRYVTAHREGTNITSMYWSYNQFKINYTYYDKDLERWYNTDNEYDPCPTGYMVPRQKQLATLATPKIPVPYQATHFPYKKYRAIWGVINMNFNTALYQGRGGLLYIDETNPEEPKTLYLAGGGILRDYYEGPLKRYRLLGFWHFQNSDAVNEKWGIEKGYPYSYKEDDGKGSWKDYKYCVNIYRRYATEGTHYWGVTNNKDNNYKHQPFLSIFHLPNDMMGAAQWYWEDSSDYLDKTRFTWAAPNPTPQFAVRCVKYETNP